jgi:hypothetical protein
MPQLQLAAPKKGASDICPRIGLLLSHAGGPANSLAPIFSTDPTHVLAATAAQCTAQGLHHAPSAGWLQLAAGQAPKPSTACPLCAMPPPPWLIACHARIPMAQVCHACIPKSQTQLYAPCHMVHSPSHMVNNQHQGVLPVDQLDHDPTAMQYVPSRLGYRTNCYILLPATLAASSERKQLWQVEPRMQPLCNRSVTA